MSARENRCRDRQPYPCEVLLPQHSSSLKRNSCCIELECRRQRREENERKTIGFTALLVDAATLAMCPIALNGVQRLIGDVEQATQVVALARLLFSCDDFWVIFTRIHQP